MSSMFTRFQSFEESTDTTSCKFSLKVEPSTVLTDIPVPKEFQPLDVIVGNSGMEIMYDGLLAANAGDVREAAPQYVEST